MRQFILPTKISKLLCSITYLRTIESESTVKVKIRLHQNKIYCFICKKSSVVVQKPIRRQKQKGNVNQNNRTCKNTGPAYQSETGVNFVFLKFKWTF